MLSKRQEIKKENILKVITEDIREHPEKSEKERINEVCGKLGFCYKTAREYVLAAEWRFKNGL